MTADNDKPTFKDVMSNLIEFWESKSCIPRRESRFYLEQVWRPTELFESKFNSQNQRLEKENTWNRINLLEKRVESEELKH